MIRRVDRVPQSGPFGGLNCERTFMFNLLRSQAEYMES